MLKVIFLVLLISITKLLAYNNILELTPSEMQYIKTHPVIKAQNEVNWPPFNFTKRGEARGYSVDYMDLLASKVGLKVEYIHGYSWEQYMQMLQTDKLDLIINISKNDERVKTIEFTKPYVTVKNAIYVNVNNQNFYSIDDLRGKTVVMTKGFYAQKMLEKNYPTIKQILVEDQLQALKLLSLGKADATVGKKIVMDYIIQKNMVSNVIATQYVENKDLISHLGIGGAKNDKTLINILTKVQQLITREELSQLSHKWFGAKMKPKDSGDINLTIKEREYLDRKKEIKLCINPSWMPFEKIENGKHIGFTSDLMETISNKINIPIKLQLSNSWTESLKKMKSRECDMLPIASSTKLRKEYMNFTTPYISAPLVIATKTNEIYINGLEKYLDQTFAVIEGYSFKELLEKRYLGIKVVGVKDVHEGLLKVEQGEVFAYLDNAVPIMYEIQKDFLGTISIVGRTTEKMEYGIASRNDEILLHQILQKLIDSISTTQIEQMQNNWSRFNHDILVDYSLVWKIILASVVTIVILMFFLSQQNVLKKEIECLNTKLKKEIEKEVKKSRKKDQTIFKQAKLVNMGEMIGNISHQWRQPLSEINSIVMKIESDFLSKKLDNDSLDVNLTKIEDLTEFMSNTIENFNNFFKMEKETKNFLVSDCVNRVIYLFESSFQKHGIKIELNIIEDNRVDSFEGEFLQVIIIILQNAKDVLLINAIKEPKIIITIDHQSRKSIVKIADNAGGVSDDIIDKIFEPYFTTKFKSKGIGIGLYMAKMIIEKNMRGTLEVQNLDFGAEFIIETPLSN